MDRRQRQKGLNLNPVAWIVLGGVLAFLAIVGYVGWRVDQATRALAEIGAIIATAGKGRRDST